MARTKRTTVADDPMATVDHQAIEQAAAASDENNQRLAEIDARYGDGQPYDMHRLVDETRFFLEQSAGAMLEAGRRLILLKEHEAHGQFLVALEEIGLAPRPAQKMMQAAAKFSGSNAPTLAHLGKSKLLELMSEDDEELAALAEGGTLAGHTLDEIERMSARELRQALREERARKQQETDTYEQLLGDKNKKIDDYERRLREQEQRVPEWPERVREINTDIVVSAGRALEFLDQLDVLRDRILSDGAFDDDDREALIAHTATVYRDSLQQVVNQVAEVMHRCYDVFEGHLDGGGPTLDQFLEQGGTIGESAAE